MAEILFGISAIFFVEIALWHGEAKQDIHIEKNGEKFLKMKKISGKIRYTREGGWGVLLGVFLGGIVFALFLVNSMRTYFSQQAGIFSDYYFRQVKYRNPGGNKMLWYLLGKRMKWAVLAMGVPLFEMSIPCMVAYMAWMGFSLGLMFSILILKFGGKGFLMGLLGIFPQALFYAIGSVILFDALYLWERRGSAGKIFPLGNVLKGMVMLFLGILTESYVNPLCLKLVFRLL